jgi:hypothetical protein
MIEDYIKQIENDIDDYEQTILALRGLALALRWDEDNRELRDDVEYRIGRRMDISVENPVISNLPDQVTPDLVVQLNPSYGVLAEAKVSVPVDSGYRRQKILQTKKYDDDLKGWFTDDEYIEGFDIVFMTHDFRRSNVLESIEELEEEDELKFSRNFIYLTFQIVAQDTDFLAFNLARGDFSDIRWTDYFRRSDNPIDLKHIISQKQVKLYDAKPPLSYLMNIIHNKIQNSMSKQELMELRKNNQVTLQINLNDLRQKLAEELAPIQGEERQPDVPKIRWLRSAFESFNEFGWAKNLEGQRNKFEYVYKKRRKPFDQFKKHEAEIKMEREEIGQEEMHEILEE